MNTMFEKVAVAGDITQAIDRRGCWSVAITVIGGTESTAVKLQSCDTADGVFTDYAELIPASEATADQYKGFVLDLYGAKKFIKVVGATMATAVLGDCDHDIKSVAITAGEVPQSADLENNKTATINVSEYTQPVEITPSEGKDGMKKATVTLSNIPSPSGSVTLYAWSSNGALFAYTLSETPSVGDDVYGGDISDYLNQFGIGGEVTAVTEDTITVSAQELITSGTYTRDSTADITIG